MEQRLEEAEREAGLGLGHDEESEPEESEAAEPSGLAELSERLARVESLLENVLAELRGKESRQTSFKARGEKF